MLTRGEMIAVHLGASHVARLHTKTKVWAPGPAIGARLVLKEPFLPEGREEGGSALGCQCRPVASQLHGRGWRAAVDFGESLLEADDARGERDEP